MANQYAVWCSMYLCCSICMPMLQKKCVVVSPKNHKVGWFLLFSWHTTLLSKNHSSNSRQTRGGLVFWYNYQTDKIITRRRCCRETSNKCVVRWHFDLFFPPLSSRKNIGSTSSHPQKYFGRAASSLKLLVYGEKKSMSTYI